jgi:hypothetical protein
MAGAEIGMKVSSIICRLWRRLGSGALEQIGGRVSSIVWLDAFKPQDGQKPIDFTNEGFRKAF